MKYNLLADCLCGQFPVGRRGDKKSLALPAQFRRNFVRDRLKIPFLSVRLHENNYPKTGRP